MRKPSLSVDTFVAALAVLGATASTGCSKGDHASVAPEPAAAVAPGAPAANAEQAPSAAAPPAQAAQAAQGAQAAPATGGPGAPADPASPKAADDSAKAPPPSAATARSATASPVGAAPVDGGVKRAAETDGKKKAGMSCGAGMCSADMKKGTGN